MRRPMQPGHTSRFLPATSTKGLRRVGAFVMLPTLIRQLGADPDVAFAAAGLAPDALGNAENRISYATLGCLLRESATLTHCPHFGLLAGRIWHLSDVGLVGTLM